MDQQNQHTGGDSMRAAIDVKLEEVVTLAISCGRSPEFISDVAPALRMLLTLMVRQAVMDYKRESRNAFNEYVLARPASNTTDNPLPAAPVRVLTENSMLAAESLARDMMSHFKTMIDGVKELHRTAFSNSPDYSDSWHGHEIDALERMLRNANRVLGLDQSEVEP